MIDGGGRLKRPLLYAALAVLAGTLAALPEAALLLKAAVLFGLAGLLIKTPGRKTRLAAAVLMGVMFTLGFLRAAKVSAGFHTPEAEAFFSRYEATNPGQFDYALYLKGQGIGNEAELNASWEDRKKDGEESERAAAGKQAKLRPKAIRESITDSFDAGFLPSDAAVLKAVLLGHKEDLDEDLRDLYQSAGISHLLAVSGLHVSMIGMGVFGLFRKRKAGRKAAGLAASVSVILYLILIGAPGSSQRAGIMLLLSFAAGGAGRSYDMLSAVFLALILMVLRHPYRIFQSGFQLSFGAVFAIALVSSEIIRRAERLKAAGSFRNGYAKRIGRAYRLSSGTKTLIVGASIQLTMLPIILWHYFTFPVYGCLLNLLVIPLMAGVLFSGLAVLAVLYLKAGILAVMTGTCAMRPGILSAAAAAPAHYILELYARLSRLSLRLPNAVVLVGRPGLWQILVYYLLLGLALTVLLPAGRKQRENTSKRAPLRLAAFSLLMIPASFTLRHLRPMGVTVTMADVGQGDGFLIETKENTVLIDCGSSSNYRLGERVLVPLLRSRGIDRVDMAIVSHADQDHISGLKYLLTEDAGESIGSLVLPGPAREHEKYQQLVSSYKTLKSKDMSDTDETHQKTDKKFEEDGIIYLSNGETILSDPYMKLYCLYAGDGSDPEDVNRHSGAIMLESGRFCMLFTGDMPSADEPEVCRRFKEACPGKQVTVLKAAHHGSASSTSEELLRTVCPGYALISAGRNNRYGHPAEETLERLAEFDVKVLETARSGAVEIHVRKNAFRIRRFLF